MTRKYNEKIDIKLLILMFIVIILIIVNLIIFTRKFYKPKVEAEKVNETIRMVGDDKKTPEQVSVPKTDEEIIKMLSGYGERDRMEYYCGQYFKHIERHEYDAAYNLLYTEFKQNYFPTVEDFEEYIKKTYPAHWALEYDDISRQGDIYVLRLKILDVLGSKENEKVQRVVVKENNYNDFVISFQVI
jgi:hypothetical protein